MNSTMVTAIELHSNQQQAQGPQYGANIQSSTMTNNSPRGGPKSPPLSSPNGIVSPSGRSQGKKSSHAKALSLQTKLAQATGSSKSSPLTALSSPSIPGHASQERGASSRRGSKRTLEDALAVEKVHFVHQWSLDIECGPLSIDLFEYYLSDMLILLAYFSREIFVFLE